MKKQGEHFYRGTRVSDIRNADTNYPFTNSTQEDGANIAGAPIDEPYTLGNDIPASDGNDPYIPRHLTPDEEDSPDKKGNYISQPDGTHVAPNGAVIENPWSEQPEIKPDHEYTSEKEDLNLMIL